jgi:hypothetical protein
MLKTLAWKESRELLPLVALVLAVQVYLVASPKELQYLVSESSGRIPFLPSDTTCQLVFIFGGTAAVAIGLWQTLWEASRGTFQFLFHRPITRQSAVLTKLAIGWLACVALTAAPILFHALYAARPGTHASPFHWTMTLWAWQLCLSMPLIYLGAFLSGLRPGRILGSRFWPLAAGPLTLVLVQVYWPNSAAVVVAALVAQGVFVFVILHVAATRDYSS